MKKIIFFSFVLCFLYSSLFSQQKLFFAADYGVFRYDNTKSLLEIYLSVNQKGLKYSKEGNKFIANVMFAIKITDKKSGTLFTENEFLLPLSVSDTSQNILSKKEISQLRFLVDKEGTYTINVSAFDKLNPDFKDRDSMDVVIGFYDLSNVDISTLQLASSIEKSSDENSNFGKYGNDVIPNPEVFFGNNLNKLYYYLEIYGLKNKYAGSNVKIIKYIINPTGKTVFSKSESSPSDYNLLLETGEIKLDSLESSYYVLKIELRDNDDKIISEESKKFYVFNTLKSNIQNVSFDEEGFLRSEFANMSEEKLEDEFEKVIYIRKQKESDQWKSLKTTEEKRKYLYVFWRERDSNPLTATNEVRTKYLKMVEIANTRFKESFKPGWKTDRGRIYLIYGEPNDIERYEYQSDIKGYQIWRYEQIEGGAICVFGEEQYDGSGIYMLMSSTIRGELRDDNWISKLRK